MTEPISELDEQLLRVLRGGPGRTLAQLADAVGPRTNFGRVLTRRVRGPVTRLVATGLVEEHDGHYELSETGRRMLGERALSGSAGSHRHRTQPRS